MTRSMFVVIRLECYATNSLLANPAEVYVLRTPRMLQRNAEWWYPICSIRKGSQG